MGPLQCFDKSNINQSEKNDKENVVQLFAVTAGFAKKVLDSVASLRYLVSAVFSSFDFFERETEPAFLFLAIRLRP